MTNGFLVICIILFPLTENVYSRCNNHHKSKKNCNGDELIFAHTICRHGDRNIYLSYQNDPWKSLKYWPEGYAQLTNIGKKQHYKLGTYLRRRYESLLGNGEYSSNKVYIRSTDVDRVLMSAEANLVGLFPPSANQVWTKHLDWHPIPVHTQPSVDDYLLATEKPCDRLDYVLLQFMNTSAYTNYFTKYRPLITYLETNSGQKLPTLSEITILYDTLSVEQSKGMRLPHWAKQVMQPGGDFEYIATVMYALYTSVPELKKIKSGYLLKEILDRFTNKTQRTLSPDRSLWMYFAHDITITNMLNSLGLYNLHVPPYASCLFFELYHGNGVPYVKIFYRKPLNAKHVLPLNIPGCGTRCPLANLYELYEDILPTLSFSDECALRSGEILPKEDFLKGNFFFLKSNIRHKIPYRVFV